MKKKLVYGLLLLSTLSVSLNSCRTDEMMTSTEQAQKEKIAFFERFEKEKSLSKNTESNNYAFPFGNSMLAYFNNYPEKKTELENKYGIVDLKVSSQDMDLENGRKLLMFPMLTDGKVTAVIGGVINAERDYLYFDVYKEGHPDRDYLINIFQQYYTSLSLNRTIDVGEVIIIVKKPQLSKPDPWDEDPGGDGHDMDGGNGDYGDGSGSSGSSGTPNTNTPTDPCAKMKSQNTPEFQSKVGVLETNLDEKKETGWVEKKDGVWEYKDTASTNDNSNSLSLGDPTGDMKGYMHTHVNDYQDPDGNMRLGFKIFSPADVIYFNQMVALAQQNGTPLDDIYAIMVSGKGNYQIRFTGNSNQIKTLYANTKTDYNEMYKEYFSKHKGKSDEMNFLKFIDEVMYVKGITLVKINSDGTTVKKTLNSTKTDVSETPCQ
ncbi:hypothetical protein EG347_06915 [Chryseobacterium sp. G0186]|uniref:hypothetical protein n=1 Tax=Chryseobacterium sp. G0186 TaxID=2487064 RepID=UPI000F4DE961|nr:hypothetical protein [Chryseobacterium sp. G0186]AZA77252.1 hypothetical protein EG347_06915 [Chryseobacterium sp. G0186]